MENLNAIEIEVAQIEKILEQTKETEQTLISAIRHVLHDGQGRKMGRKWFMILLFFAIWMASDFIYPAFKSDLLLILTVYGGLYGLIQWVSRPIYQKRELADFRRLYQQYQGVFESDHHLLAQHIQKINSLQSEIRPGYYRQGFIDYLKTADTSLSVDQLMKRYDYQGQDHDQLTQMLLTSGYENDLEASKSFVFTLLSSYTKVDLSGLL